MSINSRKKQLAEVVSQIEQFRLCGPSDDPDEQTSVLYGFRVGRGQADDPALGTWSNQQTFEGTTRRAQRSEL
jgi:hypothetical protein